MQNKKIIFMGSPLIASEYLNSLLENKIDIHAVYTTPPQKQSRGMKLNKSPVHLLALKKNIKVFHPEKLDNQVISHLKKIQPDLIIVIAYGKILPYPILQLPKNGCINIHLSILPRWRGAAPIEHALINGDKYTGITIIKLIEKLDAGPIVAQERFQIPNNFNKLDLINNLTVIGTKLLIKTIPNILTNQVTFVDQSRDNITYANKITSQNRKINFNNSPVSIINHIRAHSPKPGAWFFLNNERIKILDAKQGTSKGKISTIINKNFEIGCYGGSIQPLNLQREGKKIVTIDEFLNGFKLNLNDTINE